MDKKTAQCPMRLSPKLKGNIEKQASLDIRDTTKQTTVLLCEALHFRKMGIKLDPQIFHIEDYTDICPETEGNKRKILLNKLVDEIKLELDDSKP